MNIRGLVPMLETENLQQTIEFYEEILGFECRAFYPNEEQACWASLWHNEVEIAFSLKNKRSTSEKPLMTGSIYFHIENANELWENLKDKVSVVYPLENMNYGMREFGIRDCNGYVLNFGQNIEEN